MDVVTIPVTTDQPTIDPLHPPERAQKDEELASGEVRSSPAPLLSPTREAPSGDCAPPDMTKASLANDNMLPGLSTAVSADDSPSLQPQCAPCARNSPILQVGDNVHQGDQPSASSNSAAISESGAPHHPNANNDTSSILSSLASEDSVMDKIHPHAGAEASWGGQISTPVALHLAQMVHHTTMTEATVVPKYTTMNNLSLSMMEGTEKHIHGMATASVLSVRTNAESKAEENASQAKKREVEEVADEEETEPPIKKRKKAKDPNAPAGPKTAYKFYSQWFSTAVKEANPDLSVGKVTKFVDANWNAMSDENKAVWNRMAADDKARYQRDMDAYKNLNFMAAEEAELLEETETPKKKKIKKKAEDPNAPAGPKTAHMFYSQWCSTAAKETYPDMTVGQVTKVVAANWKAMPDENKAVWIRMAADDKERYQREMDDYMDQNFIATEETKSLEETEPPKKKKEKEAKDPNAPAWPMTAYMFYSRSGTRTTVKKANPNLTRGEVTKVVAADWKAMSDEKKAVWYRMAADDVVRYQREMDAYKNHDFVAPPAKPKTGYMFYTGSGTRTAVREANPDLTFGEVTKVVAADWNAMSDEKKAVWNRLAEDDKARYQREMDAYKALNFIAPEEAKLLEETEPPKKKKKKNMAEDPNAPAKPKSAYIFYSCNGARAAVKEANPDLSFGEVSKVVAADWKAMSDEKKAVWHSMAADDKARFQREMDAYKGSELGAQWLASQENECKMQLQEVEDAVNDERETYLLATANDSEYLSDRQCYIRSHLLEIFVTNKADVTTRRGGLKVNENQIGLRCAYCVKLKPKDRATSAVCYPSSISQIYGRVADMQRFHFEKCAAIPPQVLATYKSLKATRPNFSVSSKGYWEESARDIGLVDSSHGIQIGKDGGMEQLLMQKKVETGLLEESAATTVQRHAPSPCNGASPGISRNDALSGLTTAVAADDPPSLQEQFVPHVSNLPVEADDVHQPSATSNAAAISESGAPHPNANSDTSRLKDKAKAQRDELPHVHLPTEQDKNYGQRGVTMRPSGKWQVQYYYCGESRYIGAFDSKEIAHAAYETTREILGKETSFNREDKEAINARINVAREAVGKKKISKKKEAKRRTAAKKKNVEYAVNDERETYLFATAKDSEYLSDRQCYIRSHLLEIFVTNKADVATRPSQGAQKLNENQIGLRCAYCMNLKPKDRATSAVCYTSRISQIYDRVSHMQRFHFEKCAAIPPQVLATYKSLKTTRPNYPVSTRDYWEESARDIGLVDSSHGIKIGGMEQLLMQKKVETGLLEESAATTVQWHAQQDENDTSDYEDRSTSSSLPLLPVLEKGKDVILSKKGTTESNRHEENEPPQKQRRNKKVARDPNAPTYPRTAYTLYSTSFAARIAVEEAYPDLTSDGMTKAIAANWNAMSDESKAAWNHMATDDKERYKREMDAYKGSELEAQWLASVEENQLKMERKAAEEAAKSYSGGLYTMGELTEAGKHSSCSKSGIEVERYQISQSLWIADDEHGGEV